MVTNVYIFSYAFKEASRKPYISSSNYVLKMSNYKKEKWCDVWDNLYRSFLKKKKDKLKGTIYYTQAIKL
jgi:deoxyribodipyrimidine photolyase-related protein